MTDGSGGSPLASAVRGMVAAGVTPRAVAKVRSRVGIAAPPEVVVSALDRPLPLGGRVPGAAGDRLLVSGVDMPVRLTETWGFGGPLWVHHRGAPLEDGPSVAVVGTRRPTADGLRLAGAIAHDLALAGVTVVSGMARGIDQAAHRGALAAGGRTTGVIGTGLDVDYPAGSASLHQAVTASGGLLSEYPHGHGIRHRTQFIARNRILIGLVDAVVVVQAGERSGALNSVTWAADFGRDVMVVPFSPSERAAAGSLAVLCDGAIPVRHAADVLDALGMSVTAGTVCVTGEGGVDDSGGGGGGLAGPARQILPLLGAMPATPSALASATGLTPREVLVALSELEERSLIARQHDGVVRRR